MKLLYPAALFFLFSIPIIIAMYILKQKFEERKVSSLYLWEQVLKDMDVNTPWQKLKSSLPLILQVILALILTLAITDPFLFIKGQSGQNVIIVLDNTGSMNAAFENTTKFEEGKKRAEKVIRSLKPGNKITIISSGRKPKLELTASESKDDAVSKLKDIKPSNASGNIEDSLSLVKSMSKQYNSYKAIFFTDKEVDLKDIEGEVQAINYYSENVSLDYISHSKEEGSIKAIVRINNRSNETKSREVALYAEDKLFTLKEVELKPKETKTIYFENIPSNIKYMHAEISEKDSLNEDNVIYDVVKSADSQRVLLVSEKNVFIEKVLSSINSIELYKTNSIDNIMDKYDLYIFDGVLPNNLPEGGAVLFINPPDDSEKFNIKGSIDGGLGEVVTSPVTKYMEKAHFTVAKSKNIEIPYWGSVFLKVNSSPVGFIGENKGRKTAVLAFDLHNSDFPLISEFPIFMHNIVSYLTNVDFQGQSSYYCGDEITVNPLGTAEKMTMESPSGTKEDIEVKYPIRPYESTNDMGIYKLTQTSKEGETESLFALNFPTDTESNIDREAKSVTSTSGESLLDSSVLNLRFILIIAAIVLLIAEWMVYVYGY